MDENTRNKVRSILTFTLTALLITGIFFYITYEVQTEQNKSKNNFTVYYFYGQECPYCHETTPYIQELVKKYPDVDIRVLEVWHNQTNKELATQKLSQIGKTYTGVPLVIVENTTLVGSIDIPNQLEGLIINKTGGR